MSTVTAREILESPIWQSAIDTIKKRTYDDFMALSVMDAIGQRELICRFQMLKSVCRAIEDQMKKSNINT